MLRDLLYRLALRFSRISALLLLVPFFASACSWDYTIWQIQSKSADPLYRFVQDGKAGYIDSMGKVVIKPQFEAYRNYGGEFHDGLLKIDGDRYVDRTGKEVIVKGQGWAFAEGLAASLDPVQKKWGYIDRTGEFVISPRFDTYPNGYVYPFSDALAMIEVGKRYGYIDRSGEFVIQPKFLNATEFHEGIARVVVEGPCLYYDEGPCQGARSLGEAGSEKASACKFAFIDKFGSIVSSERYDAAKEFSDGVAPVRVGDKWAYVDKTGRRVIQTRFDEANPFMDGLALVKLGDRCGYIDHSGKLVIPALYEYAQDFSDGLAVVCIHWDSRDENLFYINRKGEQAFADKFALASHFFRGLAHVKLKSNKKTKDDDDEDRTKGTFAYIDTSGRKVFTYEGER